MSRLPRTSKETLDVLLNLLNETSPETQEEIEEELKAVGLSYKEVAEKGEIIARKALHMAALTWCLDKERHEEEKSK